MKKYSLQEAQQELRNVKGGFDAPLPDYTGGGEVSILIGLQDISLDTVLLDILPSGLGVYQCPFVDVWGRILPSRAHTHRSGTRNLRSTELRPQCLGRRTSVDQRSPVGVRSSSEDVHVCVVLPPGEGVG